MADQWASAPELHGELAEARADTEYWKARQQRTAADLVSMTSELNDATVVLAALEDERDAARAEVAALREQMSRMYQAETFTDTDGYPSIRVIKAIERVDENEWAMIIRREALADLRAKVEGMRDGALEGFRSQPHRSHLGTMASTLERVLALIEEAERG